MNARPSGAICIIVLLGALNHGARAQSPPQATFTATPNGQINFVLPSNDIGCTFTPRGGTLVYKPFDGGPELSCDRTEPKYVRVVLTEKRVRRFDDVGDRGCCIADNIFAYGSRWSHGPFTCEAAEAGLTCRRTDGRGFFMGRSDVNVR